MRTWAKIHIQLKGSRNLDKCTYHEAVKNNGVDLYEPTCKGTHGISLPEKIIVILINKYVIFVSLEGHIL